MLVVLGLAALLVTLAVPSFASWLQDSRRDAAVIAVLHAVHLARQVAATHGESAELCGGLESRRCSGLRDWTGGLLVSSGDRSFQREWPASSGRGAPRLHSNRNVVRFEGGTGFASPSTITICDRRGSEAARAVIISRSGRPRVDRVAQGDPLPC
jgi:type IV fimbrial biogenesis protein FimT